jgi:hypothetical protein
LSTCQHRKQLATQVVDPVWDRIRTEAEEITREDTSLGGFIFTSVLNPGSFEEACATGWRSGWATRTSVRN